MQAGLLARTRSIPDVVLPLRKALHIDLGVSLCVW